MSIEVVLSNGSMITIVRAIPLSLTSFERKGTAHFVAKLKFRRRGPRRRLLG